MKKGELLIKNCLGDDFWESLEKSNELFKLNTQTALDPEEIRIGLKVVPRVLMSFLVKELVPLKNGEHKKISLPCGENAVMNVTKGDADSYSGNVISDNKPVYDFRNRSIPGIGIILLSTFELYDMSLIDHEEKHSPEMGESVQKMIDDRLEQRALIEKVVEQKMTEREAIHKLVMGKLSEALKSSAPFPGAIPFKDADIPPAVAPTKPIEVTPADMIKKEQKKGSPLKAFIERKKPKEFAIQMEKSETVNCPDCSQAIFGNSTFSGCICFGMDQNRKLWIKKSEDGVKIRFSRGWDEDNISLLLEVLRGKK